MVLDDNTLHSEEETEDLVADDGKEPVDGGNDGEIWDDVGDALFRSCGGKSVLTSCSDDQNHLQFSFLQ